MEQKKDINGNYFYHAIHGKVNDSFQYRMNGCVELETLQLSSLEINEILKNKGIGLGVLLHYQIETILAISLFGPGVIYAEWIKGSLEI